MSEKNVFFTMFLKYHEFRIQKQVNVISSITVRSLPVQLYKTGFVSKITLSITLYTGNG